MEAWRKRALALVIGAFPKQMQETVTITDWVEWNRNKKKCIEAYRRLAVNEVNSIYKYILIFHFSQGV